MIDPVLCLALALHASPGVYALLIGSGLSTTAGIPTGWGIVEDLIGQLARAAGEPMAAGETPEAWFRRRFGAEAQYSSLLDELGGTPAERQALLRRYFEPTAEERAQGLKLPTRAHRAIAQLMAGGKVRVVITTNFDPLLETALRDEGINPVVIASADAATGAPPLQHAAAVVIKINGDYLDSRILNTVAELSAYDAAMDQLLGRVLEEYGLVICGWSGDWDTALRTAMERATARRYSLFWATRGALGAKAEALLALRQGKRIAIRDAEHFFPELADKVAALADIEPQHPLAPDVAVARLKRALAEPAKGRIAAHDLVMAEVEELVGRLIDEKTFSPMDGLRPDTLQDRLRRYQAMSATIAALIAIGVAWGDAAHERVWGAALERLTNLAPPSHGYEVWRQVQRYPALYLLYAAGITAVARGDYVKLAGLLRLPQFENDRGDRFPLGRRLYPNAVLEVQTAQLHLGLSQHAPLSLWLFEALRPTLRPLIPRDEVYQEAFDRFELLLSLFGGIDSDRPRFTGCFAWRDALHGHRDALATARAEIEAQRADWAPFKSGLLPASGEAKVRKQLDTLLETAIRAGWRHGD